MWRHYKPTRVSCAWRYCALRKLRRWKKLFLMLLASIIVLIFSQILLRYTRSESRAHHWLSSEGKDLVVSSLFRRRNIIIIVPSTESNLKARTAIRRTWGNTERYRFCTHRANITVVFAIGRTSSEHSNATIEEMAKYRDVILLDITEDYFNLTLKTILVLEWAHKHAREAELIVKADDDTFVNIPAACRLFQRHYTTHSYGGRCSNSPRPLRNATTAGKFYISHSEYNASYYPPYCEGPFYFMDRATLERVQPFLRNTPRIKFEDVFVGSALKNAGLTFHNINSTNNLYVFRGNTQFTNKEQVEYMPEMLRVGIAFHPVTSPERMRALHIAALRRNPSRTRIMQVQRTKRRVS